MTAFTVNIVYNDNTSGNVMDVRVLRITPLTTLQDVITFLKLQANTALTTDDNIPFLTQKPLADQGVSAGSYIYINAPRL